MGLIIHAPNVHLGGGRTLLMALLKAAAYSGQCLAVVDARMKISTSLTQNVLIQRVRAGFIDRLKAEWNLRRRTTEKDTVLCLGNLPPLFKIKAKAFVFVQNRYLVEKTSLKGFRAVVRLRIMLERRWLAWRAVTADGFIVQTATMQRIMNKNMGIIPDVIPFSEATKNYSRSAAGTAVSSSKKYDFLYIASGEPHKNHRRLIEAWCMLAEEGIYPSLCITVQKVSVPDLCEWIEQVTKTFALRIENIQDVNYTDASRLYVEAGALIYPSMLESMGLPLIEARCACLPILASEMDYVRDVIDPEQSFAPDSAISIARAVKRHLGIKEKPLPLRDAEGFLKCIMSKSG